MRKIQLKPGQQVRNVTFIADVPARIRRCLWRCRCGIEFEASLGNIKSGSQKSCGCLKVAAVIKRCTKHGMSPAKNPPKLYRCWQSMKDRCLNRNNRHYRYYGGRGIGIYKPWMDDFTVWLGYLKQHGMAEIPYGMTLDRIDTNRGYEPGNIRWASRYMQSRNRRSTALFHFQGKDRSLGEIAEIVGVKRGTLWARLNIQKLKPAKAFVKCLA